MSLDFTKRAGPMVLRGELIRSPVNCITYCLARKDGTEEFYTIKILTLKKSPGEETFDDIKGKILIHTEYSLLKLLKGEKGIVQQHGLYKDFADEEIRIGKKIIRTGNIQTRINLVLDCYNPHDFCPKYNNFIGLQDYVNKNKGIPEALAIKILHNVVQIVERLHKRNIVHRDLKLGSIVLNLDTNEVTLTNFGLGKHLTSENEMLVDQRGSPAYVSPELVSGKPYSGKPNDIWALGISLFAMLYGHFPFFDMSPTELFRKIKLAEFQIPSEPIVSLESIKLIKSLIVVNPSLRLTATDIFEECRRIIDRQQSFLFDSDLHIVPDFNTRDDIEGQRKMDGLTKIHQETALIDIEAMLADIDKPIFSLKYKDVEDDKVHQPPTTMDKNASTLGGLNATDLIEKGGCNVTHKDSCLIVPTQKTINAKPLLGTAQTFSEFKTTAPQISSNGVVKVRKTRAARNMARGTRVSTNTAHVSPRRSPRQSTLK